jgi:hypothetical protein
VDLVLTLSICNPLFIFRLTEDVLKRLHQMSSESLAANGESIRHKVLFIASSLLNKYPAQDSAGHEHVADFLQGERGVA